MPRSRPLPPDRRRFREEDEDFGEEAPRSAGLSPLAKGLLAFAAVFVLLGGIGAAAATAWFLLRLEGVAPAASEDAPAAVAGAPANERPSSLRGGNPVPPAKPRKQVPVMQRETLQHVKAATVFIKMETDEFMASGSGFVMKVEDDTVWIVTNDHVVSPPPERQNRFGPDFPRLPGFGRGIPRPPGLGGSRFPRIPRMGQDLPGLGPGMRPGLPGIPDPFDGLPFSPGRPVLPGEQRPSQQVRYTVVFHSGTPREESYPAVVIGATKEPDLAVLKVGGVENPPEPLNLGEGVPAEELMPVLFLGFPFGLQRSLDNGNPAVSVNKATVASLRRNPHGGTTVEISGDVNPGNSGGPLVDSEGRLIGIIFAKYDNTRIGLAVHAADLDHVLQPRIGSMSVASQTVNGVSTMQMEVAVSDPLLTLSDITFLYVRGDAPAVERHPQTQWEPLPQARQIKLPRRGLKAVATLRGQEAELAQQVFTYQFAYRDRDGHMRYSEPRRFGTPRK